MQNAQPHRCGDQLASHAVILRLLHFLANVTELAKGSLLAQPRPLNRVIIEPRRK